MTLPLTASPSARRPALAGALLAAALLGGCGGGKARKQEDGRVQDLARQVAQLSAQVKAQDARIAKLGTGDTAAPLAVSTQSGPGNTVVAQCPPGAFLFRLPRTPSQGGESLCRPIAAPTGGEIRGH